MPAESTRTKCACNRPDKRLPPSLEQKKSAASKKVVKASAVLTPSVMKRLRNLLRQKYYKTRKSFNPAMLVDYCKVHRARTRNPKLKLTELHIALRIYWTRAGMKAALQRLLKSPASSATTKSCARYVLAQKEFAKAAPAAFRQDGSSVDAIVKVMRAAQRRAGGERIIARGPGTKLDTLLNEFVGLVENLGPISSPSTTSPRIPQRLRELAHFWITPANSGTLPLIYQSDSASQATRDNAHKVLRAIKKLSL